ncbi:MAG: aromatic ring-hydroxylating dioxygenase subunit alpha [Pseudomonadota bacterium]
MNGRDPADGLRQALVINALTEDIMASDLDTRRLADKAKILDVAAGRTLPAYYYTDPAVLEIEKRELFFTSWQFACHVSALDRPGSYKTMEIFDQEIVLTCDGDGTIRAFYNVCAHRGHALVEGAGEVRRLVCPYHAWTYALDGRLIGVRRGEGTTAVARSEICLTEIRTDRLLDFIFVNLDPDAAPMAELYPGIEAEIEAAIPGVRSFVPTSNQRRADVPMQCNWKVILDNYLECYHCEAAHASFCDLVRVDEVSHRFADRHMHQYLPPRGKADNAAYPLDLAEDQLDSNFWFLFPNITIGHLPGVRSLTISRIVPLTPETSARRFTMLMTPGGDRARDQARTDFLLSDVGAEDVALCEGVQRGMRQRGFNQGHYMIDPDDENFTEEGVRFFHRLYCEALEARLAAETR